MKILLFILIALFSVSAIGQSPEEIESKLMLRLENLAKFSNYGGSGDYEKLETENALFREDLLRFGKIPETLAYSFPKLNGRMQVTTSRDGKLRIYSWDMETGGTMHDFDAVYQYKGASGKAYTWAEERGEDFGAGVFYHDIFQVNTSLGTVYLPVSTFVGSTSLAGQSISAVKIENEKFVPKVNIFKTGSGLTSGIGFGYDFFSVVDRKERPIRLFEFNEARKEFKFPVVIEDEETPQGRVTNKFITYRFNGRHFVKIN